MLNETVENLQTSEDDIIAPPTAIKHEELEAVPIVMDDNTNMNIIPMGLDEVENVIGIPLSIPLKQERNLLDNQDSAIDIIDVNTGDVNGNDRKVPYDINDPATAMMLM